MVLARNIMDTVAVIYNDPNRTSLTYAVQMPFLNMALRDLRSQLELYGMAVTNRTVQDIEVPANCVELTFNAIPPLPRIPADLIEPMEMYERPLGNNVDYIPMQKMQFLPTYTTEVNSLIYWTWQDQKIKFIGANTDNEIRIDYTANVLPNVTDVDDSINVINAQPFLEYRTAALCSKFIGENESRSSELNTTAQLHLDAFLGTGIKHMQAIGVRRRPFQQAFKLWGAYL